MNQFVTMFLVENEQSLTVKCRGSEISTRCNSYQMAQYPIRDSKQNREEVLVKRVFTANHLAIKTSTHLIELGQRQMRILNLAYGYLINLSLRNEK